MNQFRLGDVIKVGRLAFVPVYGPDTDYGFVEDVSVSGDTGGYGGLTLSVKSAPTIVPDGLAFFLAGGQDRAVRRLYVVTNWPMREPLDVAVVCVEPAQGARWRKGQGVRKGVLPPSLMAGMSPDGSYSDLWKSIRQRGKAAGKITGDVRALLKGQVGSCTLDSEARGVLVSLDGRPLAFQVAPSRKGFAEWWEAGLGAAWAFEAESLPVMPLPLGDLDLPDIEVGGEPCFIKWGPFSGWCVGDGYGGILYVNVLDEDALRSFYEAADRGHFADVAGSAWEEWPE